MVVEPRAVQAGRSPQVEQPLAEIGLDAEWAKGQKVRVDPPPADNVAPGWGEDCLAGPRQERSGQQNRGPDAAAEVGVEVGLADLSSLDGPRVSIGGFDLCRRI